MQAQVAVWHPENTYGFSFLAHLGNMWPCLFCICQLKMVYPAHHGMFWIGGSPGAWLGKSVPKIGDLGKLDLAWEAHFGIRMDPNLSVWTRINPGTPSGCIRTHTEGFGSARILSDFFGNVRKALLGFRHIWIGSDGAWGGWVFARTYPY